MSARARVTRLRRWQIVTGFFVLLSAMSVMVGIAAARSTQSYYSATPGSGFGADEPTSAAEASRRPRAQESWPVTNAAPTTPGPSSSATPSAAATPGEAGEPTNEPAAGGTPPAVQTSRTARQAPAATVEPAPTQLAASPHPAPAAPAAPVAPAAAPAEPNPATFTNLATGLCLDSNEGNVYTLGCNNGDYQRWTVYGFGEVLLIDKATGLCLASNSNDLNVYPAACGSNNRQRWTMRDGGYGTVNILNVASRLCLDSNREGAAYTQGCNGGSYQRWQRD